MSTTPNALTDADVEKYVAEIAAKKYQELNKESPQEPTTPAPITLNIAGKEMTFKDATEASSVLTSVYQQQTQAPPAPVGRTVTSDTENAGWTADDQKKFVDQLVLNPISAIEMLDEKRFGVKNPTEVMKQNMAAVQSMATQMTIDQFVASHKDYHVSEDNAAAMQKVLTELGGGRPVINPMALEAAFAIADKRGMIKRPEQKQEETRGYNPYLAAPPVSGRGSSQVSPSFEQEAEAMSLEQIEALFARNR